MVDRRRDIDQITYVVASMQINGVSIRRTILCVRETEATTGIKWVFRDKPVNCVCYPANISCYRPLYYVHQWNECQYIFGTNDYFIVGRNYVGRYLICCWCFWFLFLPISILLACDNCRLSKIFYNWLCIKRSMSSSATSGWSVGTIWPALSTVASMKLFAFFT